MLCNLVTLTPGRYALAGCPVVLDAFDPQLRHVFTRRETIPPCFLRRLSHGPPPSHRWARFDVYQFSKPDGRCAHVELPFLERIPLVNREDHDGNILRGPILTDLHANKTKTPVGPQHEIQLVRMEPGDRCGSPATPPVQFPAPPSLRSGWPPGDSDIHSLFSNVFTSDTVAGSSAAARGFSATPLIAGTTALKASAEPSVDCIVNTYTGCRWD